MNGLNGAHHAPGLEDDKLGKKSQPLKKWTDKEKKKELKSTDEKQKRKEKFDQQIQIT